MEHDVENAQELMIEVIKKKIIECAAAAIAANQFDAKDVLSIKQAADLLHMHEVTIRRMIGTGDFPAHKIGAFYYIYRPELKKWFLDHGNK